jgi:hypothetical protein
MKHFIYIFPGPNMKPIYEFSLKKFFIKDSIVVSQLLSLLSIFLLIQ